jgi:hypothetical protein
LHQPALIFASTCPDFCITFVRLAVFVYFVFSEIIKHPRFFLAYPSGTCGEASRVLPEWLRDSPRGLIKEEEGVGLVPALILT